MNFKYPGGTDFSRLEESNVSVLTWLFSLGGSSNGNSKSPVENFFVIIIVGGSWLVVVESSEPFAWLELGSSCFDLLDWDKERGSGSSSDLSLLHMKGRDEEPILGGAMVRGCLSCYIYKKMHIHKTGNTCVNLVHVNSVPFSTHLKMDLTKTCGVYDLGFLGRV